MVSREKFISAGVLYLIVLGLCLKATAAKPSAEHIILTTQNWTGKYDASGHVEESKWDYSQYHPHGYHDLLSGEWGAAIFYDGITTEPNAMWLTDYFEAPYWTTNSDFQIGTVPTGWDDANNPIDGYDTGLSVIENNEVEVRIDYEIAGFGENEFSPLAYREPNETVRIKRSDSYVILQTYTVKNIKASGNVTGLEFYQFLHAHGADDYGPVIHCCYETFEYDDALEDDYTPYNPVHTVGNFRYDITQWNNMEDVNATANHADWVGFSCTVEPNVYECGYFKSGVSDFFKPPTGTHISIEERNFDSNDYSYGMAAGALGWYLPELEPDESTSITVAFMFGTLNWPIPTILTKTNADPNDECVYPWKWNMLEENYLTFDVCYDANGYALSDALLIDYLPLEVDYNSCSGGGEYDANNHTITWELGEVEANASNCFEVVTKVNYYARPGGVITNHIVMDSEHIYYAQTSCDVNVCNYGRAIIYVDKDANGFNNGTRWNDAYTDLQDAFTGAKNIGADITAIWVAAGTYKPVWDVNEDNYKDYSFELLEDVGLFGHFGGVGPNETSTNQRDFADANNETVLEGQIGQNYDDAVRYVVKADDVDDALINGFTIQGSYNSGAGIFLDDSNVAIENCKLKNNRNYGIDVTNYSYPDIHNCVFLDNSSQGVRVYNHCRLEVSASIFDGNDTTSYGIYMSSYSVVSVSDCTFKKHGSYGINGYNGMLTVTDSVFDDNQYGLDLSDVNTTVTNCSIKNSDYTGIDIYNCDLTIDHSVIANNGDNGVYASSDSNLTIKNSVVRYSGEHGIELHDNLVTIIKNNWIHNNGTEEDDYYGGAGIYFNNQSSVPLVRNNTIYDNWTYGLQSSGQGEDPNVINCIIYANDSNDFYRENGTFDTVNYCNLQNSHDGTGNITGDPGFMNIGIDSDDLHLDVNSQCKDRGDPNGDYGDETDIDGESRIKYGRVDIGADEYYYSLADFDEDGKVNLVDYAIIAGAWQTEPNDNNYEEDCDLEDNNAIDYNDVALFCEDWMWQAAWPEKEILLATDFESGIPTGWMVVDGYSDDKTWMTNNPEGRDSPYWTGDFCIVDSDWAGAVDMNEMLITRAIDCSGTVEVVLEFSHYFLNYEIEKCDVDISINDGPWQTVLQYDDETEGNVTEDISALAADQPNVRVRWHYYDANWEWYWGIDNVKIIGNFRIPPMQMMAMGGGGMGFGGLESMSLALFSLEKSPTSSAANTDDLMLSNAESMAARPERLVAKSQKFYDITPARTISGKQKLLELERILDEISTKIILKQFDEMWYRGEIKKVMTEDEYLEFRKAIEVSLQSWPFARIR